MPDYGHDLLFGCFLAPTADRAETVVTLARLAEATGLDLVTVQDHPYQPRFLDTWTLLSHLGARTSRVRLAPNVANLPLRPPAVLAKAAASIDILTEGRFELGLGAGAFWDAIEAMGASRRSPGEAVTALEEAIAVIRALWTPGRTPRIDGRHYQLRGAKPGPFPAHEIGIWLGAYGPRMLSLTGREADGWIPSQGYAPPERLAGLSERIDAATVDAGRRPADVRRLYNVDGAFGAGGGFLQGSADDWVEQIADLALTVGISGFILSVDVGSAKAMQRFAEEVAPAVRLVVERERTSAAPAGEAEPAAPEPVRVSAPEEPAGLEVTPTPDDGRRLSDESAWDESARPAPPVPVEGATYTPLGRRDAEALVQIHNHLRAELAQLRDLVQQVTAGTREIGEARELISQLTLRQNSWTLGTYCQTYCRVVAVHHTIEDQGWFPRLREADAALGAPLDRLAEEHEVIGGLLERVDAALVRLVAEPAAVDGVRRAVDLLGDALLSHLSYEERVLVEPLARLDLRLL